MARRFNIETEFEAESGRWIAEATEVNGALAYGRTKEEAIRKAMELAAESFAEGAD